MKDSIPPEEAVEKINLNFEIVAVGCKGNIRNRMVIQVVAPIQPFSLLISSREFPLGVLEHALIMGKGELISRKTLREMGWKVLSKMEA